VHDLDGRGEERGVIAASCGPIRGEEEDAAKALAATQETVPNGSGDFWRALVESSEPGVAETREGAVDLTSIRLDFADDAGVENVGAAAISHENR
jgi:hypothetical protein